MAEQVTVGMDEQCSKDEIYSMGRQSRSEVHASKADDSQKGIKGFITEYGGSAAILLVLALAFILRAWGFKYGLPNFFHPDEWAIVDRAMNMLRTGDYNPKDFVYPSFYMYNAAVVFTFRFFYGVMRAQYDNLGSVNMEGIYTWGRLLTAIYGTANVFIIYKAGTKLFGRATGIVSALFLAVAFLHVRDSHYITVDVPATTLATLSFLFACGIFKFQDWKYYLLAGLAGGLATATKWNLAPVLICMLVAHFLVYARREPINGRLFAGLGAFMAGLYIGTPYAFLDPTIFLKNLAEVFVHYRSGHPGFEAASPLMFYLKNIAGTEGISIAITLMGAAGLILSMARHRAKDFFLVAFPFIYILVIAGSTVTFPRTAMPLYPFIALYAGLAVTTLWKWLAKKYPMDEVLKYAVLVVLAIAIAAPSAARAIQFDMGSCVTSTRVAAGTWISENLPKGSKIAAEFYAPPISGEHEVVKLPMTDFKPQYFIDEGFDYMVFDGADFQRYYDDPVRYREKVAKYDALFKLGSVVKKFAPDKRVELFLSPEIRIVEVEQLN